MRWYGDLLVWPISNNGYCFSSAEEDDMGEFGWRRGRGGIHIITDIKVLVSIYLLHIVTDIKVRCVYVFTTYSH